MINLVPYKQHVENNLFYGENSREQNRAKYGGTRPLMASLVMPNGTKIFGIDISHWNKPPVDLKRMKELYKLQFVVIKGVDGALNSNYYLDHVAAAKAAGIPWGMYVWLYPNNKVSIDAQVNAWFNRFQQDPPPMGLFIDAEWTNYAGLPANPTAADLRMAHDKWKTRSGKKAITYTAQGYADQNLTGFDWSREELWIANYGVTSPALPKGATAYKFWQFTSTLDGKQLDPNGNAELDGDYYNGTQAEFNTRYSVAVPQSDVTTYPHDGMKRKSGKKNGWQYELFTLDPRKWEFRVLYLQQPETISSVVKRTGAVAGWNTGDYNRFTYQIQDWLVSDGKEIVTRDKIAARPSLIIKSDDLPKITHINETGTRQAFTGIRYLISASVLQPYLFGSGNEYIEGHARFVFGLDAAGNVLLFSSQGIHPSLTVFDGLRLREAGAVLQDNGAIVAADGGGGGDVTCVLDGQSLIVPENEEGGVHFERPLPAALLLFPKGNTMTTRYEATAIGNDTRTRPNHNTLQASNGAYVAGTVFYGDVLWIADATNKDVSQYVGDKWLQIDSTHWVAIVHQGKQICTLKDNGTVTPPAVKIESLTIEPAPGTVFTWLYSDNTTKKETV